MITTTNEELAIKIKAGEREFVPVLWDQVKSFVYWKARQRFRLTDGLGGVEIEDLVQSGFFALLEAVEAFDPEAGSFLTMLGWKLSRAFSEAAGIATTRTKHDPLHYATSLDVPLSEDDDNATTRLEMIPDDRDDYEDADQRMWLEELREALDTAMNDLPDIEKRTLRRRFYDDMTLREIAEADAVSLDRVRQREKKALHTLKQRQRRNGLNQFYEEHRRELDERTPWYMTVGVERFNRTHSSAVEEIVFRRDSEAKRAYRAHRYRLRLEAERCQEGNPQSLDD